jgi:hypothetical protein
MIRHTCEPFSKDQTECVNMNVLISSVAMSCYYYSGVGWGGGLQIHQVIKQRTLAFVLLSLKSETLQ